MKEALDRLGEEGWAKKWSSQPYMSRRTVYIRSLYLSLPVYSTNEWMRVGVEELMRLCFFVSDIASGADNSRNQERRDSCHP